VFRQAVQDLSARDGHEGPGAASQGGQVLPEGRLRQGWAF